MFLNTPAFLNCVKLVSRN